MSAGHVPLPDERTDERTDEAYPAPRRGPMPRRGVVVQFGVGFVLIVSAWLFGVVARVSQRQLAPLPPRDVVPPAQFEQLYGEAWNYVNSEFYGDRPSPAAITDGAVEGMVEALDDPWALVGTPEAAAQADAASDAPGSAVTDDDPLAPAFLAPLALWIADTSRGARVLAVLPGGGAAEAGIEAGDLIVRAENSAGEGVEPTPTPVGTQDSTSDDLNAVTSGDRVAPVASVLADGSLPAVAVVVSRNDTSIFARTMTRSVGSIGSIGGAAPAAAEVEMDGDVLRVRLAHLLPGAADALSDAVAEALAETSGRDASPSSIILDLRDNPGGSRSELARVAGRFMSGTVWIERSRGDERTEHAAEAAGSGPSLSGAALVVLVNGGTGDEAEMLAAALRDVRAAQLVGEPTFGHATLQSLRAVGRLQLRLTTGTWQSPSGADVAGTGIAPDVVVEERSEQDAAALDLTTAAREAQAADGGG